MQVHEQRVVVRVDRQHGEAELPLAERVAPGRPQAGDAERLPFGVRESGGDGLAGAPVGLVDRLCRHDAVARRPGVLEAGQLGDGLGARVVRALPVVDILGEPGQQPEACIDHFKVRNGLVARSRSSGRAEDRRHLRRVDVQTAGWHLPIRRQSAVEAFLDLLAALFGLVMATHGRKVARTARPTRLVLARLATV